MQNQGYHLSKDTLDLVKAIGDSRSKQEEDKIIMKECEILKTKIKESGITPKKMKEYLIRAIYVEMLGHEAPYTHLYAVNLTQDKNLLNKRVGYLACILLLSDQSEFLIMLIASLQKDIQSTKWVEVCMALVCVVKFANSTIMQAVTEPVIKLLDSKNEHIRKKAVICLYKFYQVNPNLVQDCDERMRRLLCDYDPSVMGATLCYFKDMVCKYPEKYKDLVSPLIVILKQIIDHKLPNDFDYHRFPAPWIQVTILEILSILGRDDQSASENMYEIITQALRRADDTGINIGCSIVYQCLKTICTIYPNTHLIELASVTISRFLSSDSPNLRCTGINGLALIIKINPEYVVNHQHIIVDCLEVNDETLKKNTFELLYQMTTLNNVEIIVNKMINYLKKTTLESISKKDILTKITELTERFAPSKIWFIHIMNQLFVNFGDMITDDILSKLIKIITDWERETENTDEFKAFTIENYGTVVENYAILPDSFVKLMAWVIGEYTNKLYSNDISKIEKILQMVVYLLNKSYDDDMTKCLLITAISKVHSNLNFTEFDFVSEVFDKYSRDKHPEIQQRCLEYKRMKSINIPIKKNDFFTILEDITIDSSLSFLNRYVEEKSNGKIYDEDYSEQYCNKFVTNDFQLNVGPYDTPNSILSMPGKSQNMNILYENKDNVNHQMKTDLTVRGAQKWGEEGYIDNKSENYQKKESGTLFSNTNPSTNPYSSVSSGNPQSEIGSSYSNNTITGPSSSSMRKKENKEPVSKYTEEQTIFMKKLFSDGKSDISPPISSSGATSIYSSSKLAVGTAKGGDTKGFNPVQKPQKYQSQSIQQNPQPTVDLLNINELYSPDNQINQQPQTIPTTASSSSDLFDIFGQQGPPQQTTQFISSTQQKPIQGGSLFDNLTGIKPTVLPSQVNPMNNYVSFQINSEQLEHYWETLPEEKQYEIKANVNSPEQFHQIIAKRNFYPVAIDANEAITSCKYKNYTTLIHATILQGSIPLQIKCENPSLTDEIANYLITIFK